MHLAGGVARTNPHYEEDAQHDDWQQEQPACGLDQHPVHLVLLAAWQREATGYLGRWILHSGWYPDRKLRLFDRRKARWTGEFVHESVKVDGAVGHLNSNILHYTCSSLSEHLRTMDRYTTLAAEQLVASRRQIGWTELLLDPPWTFINTFLLKRGFLDGMEGLAIAYMAAHYNFLKYAKARLMSPER